MRDLQHQRYASQRQRGTLIFTGAERGSLNECETVQAHMKSQHFRSYDVDAVPMVAQALEVKWRNLEKEEDVDLVRKKRTKVSIPL